MKNNSRTFGGNKKGPGFRTPSSFRGQVSLNRGAVPKKGWRSHPPKAK
jgi:hypothetical protein